MPHTSRSFGAIHPKDLATIPFPWGVATCSSPRVGSCGGVGHTPTEGNAGEGCKRPGAPLWGRAAAAPYARFIAGNGFTCQRCLFVSGSMRHEHANGEARTANLKSRPTHGGASPNTPAAVAGSKRVRLGRQDGKNGFLLYREANTVVSHNTRFAPLAPVGRNADATGNGTAPGRTSVHSDDDDRDIVRLSLGAADG
jgi:hypothetical protein